MYESAMEKVLFSDNLLREVKSYVDINPLLNSCRSQLDNKRSCFEWKFTSEATYEYYENQEFQNKIHSLVNNPKNQIHLNEYVRNHTVLLY